MFVDSVTVDVRSGRGGDGAVSFRREKYVPRGGPDGGDGGDGGSVRITADESIESLEHLAGERALSAGDGRPGERKKKKGAKGKDLVLRVPPGTAVTDLGTGIVIKKLRRPGASARLAEGGKGGRGNARFSTPENRKPTRMEHGTKGGRRRLRLDCRLACDVAIVGPPNSGKSSLLAALTSAHLQVADYHFTTTNANIGRIQLPDYTDLLAVDLPALVDGSNEGAGLGNAFLRHAEGARLFVLTVEGCRSDCADDVETVRREIKLYSRSFADRPWIIACTKTDLGLAAEPSCLADRFAVPVVEISTESGEGIDKLLDLLVSYTS